MFIKLFKITVMFGMIFSTGSFATKTDGSVPKQPHMVKKEFVSYDDCINSHFEANAGSKKSDFTLVCNYLHPTK